MKNEHLMSYYCGKAARAAQGLGLTLLLALLLLLTSCGGSSTTNSPPTSAPASTPINSDLTLSQAQQQASYHLLSIPSSLAGYTLKRVNVFGTPGQEVYSLYYSMGKTTITLIEGQPMGNQLGSSKVSLRGTTAILSMGRGITTLSWTEKGVSRSIIGQLSSAQAVALAKSLV